MSDTEEMRRLILHAADRLASERNAMGEHGQATRNTIAAMAYAQATLRMVAACMATETEALPKATPTRDEHGRFVKGGA